MSSRTARASRGTKRKPRFSRCRFTRVEQDSFGIWPTIPVARNIGQMLKQVQHDMGVQRWLIGLPRGLRPLAMTPPVKAESCLGWSLKSHVQPLWMALSAFTMADRLSRFHNWQVGLRSAFTMAEILLSLTIIGLVAAITLPALTGNINERTWNTQRKALYARMSQAIPLMGSVNGFKDAETFITAGLSSVLKINNICDNSHLSDCGITSKKITRLNSTTMDVPTTMAELNPLMINVDYSGEYGEFSSSFITDSEAAAFETQNGESILLFYNPTCVSSLNETGYHQGQYFSMQPKFCVNMIYDLNGAKGPNTVNKDIGFITVLYPTDSEIVAPYVYTRDTEKIRVEYASKACTALDSEYRVPNRYEIAAMFLNNELLGLSGGAYDGAIAYPSSSFIMGDEIMLVWTQSFSTGTQQLRGYDVTFPVRCVKR